VSSRDEYPHGHQPATRSARRVSRKFRFATICCDEVTADGSASWGLVEKSVLVDFAGWRRVVRLATGYDDAFAESIEGG